jgi:hypothetical protein
MTAYIAYRAERMIVWNKAAEEEPAPE